MYVPKKRPPKPVVDPAPVVEAEAAPPPAEAKPMPTRWKIEELREQRRLRDLEDL